MLPGLTPAHTRKSFHSASSPASSGSRLPIEKFIQAPEDFIVSEETGLWLLPSAVAEKDSEKSIARAGYLAAELARQDTDKAHQVIFTKIARLLGRSTVNAEGCISGGLRSAQTPARAVLALAQFEMGSTTETKEEDVPFISLCGNPDCYNARHHNVDFGGTSINLEPINLNPLWYRTQEDGSIETIWGDVLPSVEDSLTHFINFQKKNFPFVPYADAPLTATPVSQITFHPVTGCWESYMYERKTPNLANTKNGYGIMYAREEVSEVDEETGEIIKGYRRGTVLAHKLIWVADGNSLARNLERNHLCNYTRCCNPLHLEQITPEANRSHGHRARAIIRGLEKKYPGAKGYHLTPAQLYKMYIPLRERYTQLAAE